MGRAEAHERWHEINALIFRKALSELFGFGSIFDDAQGIAQPLNGCPGNKGGTLQSIENFAIPGIGHRGQDSFGRERGLGSGIDEEGRHPSPKLPFLRPL